MVVAVDGQPFQLIPWEEGWMTVEGWLDNERLLISRRRKGQYDLDSMIVLNPFTGQRTELAPNYPDINGTD